MGELQVQKLVYKNEVPDSSAGYWYMFHLYYQLITNSEAQNAYHRFLTTLARALSYGSVLFHCSTGKDRTGVVTSILLYLLGVDLSVIKDDYLITNQLSVERINRRINEAKEFDVNPAYLKSIFDISIVRPIYFKFMEKLIEDLYGSFDLYLRKQLNVPNSLINQLKNLLIKE